MRFFISVLLLFSTSAHANDTHEAEFAAAESLLRYVAVKPPLADDKFPVCLIVNGEPAPETFIDRLKDTNLHIISCGSGSLATRIPISVPKRSSDGEYQVTFGYYIDRDLAVQGKLMLAYMRQDQQGWHVLRLAGGVSF